MDPIDMMITDINCECLGLSRLCLMESAGKSLAEEVERELQGSEAFGFGRESASRQPAN